MIPRYTRRELAEIWSDHAHFEAMRQVEVAAAEVADQEVWQLATLGLSCVTNDPAHGEEVLRRAVRYIEDSRPDVEVTDVAVEVVRACE